MITLSAALKADLTQLKPIELGEKVGESENGSVWKSDSLLGHTNVLIYVDPDKINDVKECILILEEENSKHNKFGITYIVNTQATLIPTFLIKSKIRKKANNTENISYILDKNKVLINNWALRDNSANILVLDSSNRILYQYSGKVGLSQLKKIFEIIEISINKNQIIRRNNEKNYNYFSDDVDYDCSLAGTGNHRFTGCRKCL